MKLCNATHKNFDGKFNVCAEHSIRSIGQKLNCQSKVATAYSKVCI